MLYNDEIITNTTLEENLRMLRNPQGLMQGEILQLVKDTLKKLGYSSDDVSLFSESITEKILADSSSASSLFTNIK